MVNTIYKKDYCIKKLKRLRHLYGFKRLLIKFAMNVLNFPRTVLLSPYIENKSTAILFHI